MSPITPTEDDTPTGQKYPCGIGIYCDRCGHEHRGDYIVTDTMTRQQRFAVARRHLVANEGWRCDGSGDLCPRCLAKAAAEEQQRPDRVTPGQAAAEFDAGTALLVGEQVTAYAAAIEAATLRTAADRITALGKARGWSIWAADFVHPDREFVDTGGPAEDDAERYQPHPITGSAPVRPAADGQPAEECPHVWVTALDGDDQPARNSAGRTWVHCGICGQTPDEEQGR